MKKYFATMTVLMLLTACAGAPSIQTISIPVVQEIAYKDIISCKKVDDVFSDCLIKDPKYGFAVTLRIQTAKIPEKEIE